jgi:protease I
MASIGGKRVAILATDGFEQSELMKPKAALDQAGAKTEVVSLKKGSIKGWNEHDWGASVTVDRTVEGLQADPYDALVLPGGVMNPDKLRTNPEVRRFVRQFFDEGKPVAAICHGPWTLIDAGVISGRRVTSWPSLRTDLENAGAQWVDEPVVVDNGLVTSRQPADIPEFNRKMVEEIAEGRHAKAGAGHGA